MLDLFGERPVDGTTLLHDQLSVWMTSERVGIEQVLSAIMDVLAERDRGRHAHVLLPAATLQAPRPRAAD